MTKTLIIAEKPSVANDIAKTLGGFTKHDEYFESDQYVLSSAVGQLVEIMVPEEYDVKRGKWSFKHLPVLPPVSVRNIGGAPILTRASVSPGCGRSAEMSAGPSCGGCGNTMAPFSFAPIALICSAVLSPR